ncbi:MAG: type II secretion system F family protein, partial [Phycisphaerae bacterium]|nr:type II secretion system F family protein [Phycisphaerae bacterium]
MPSFRYQGIGSAGAGVIEAQDRSEAMRMLSVKGVVATSLEEVRENGQRVRGQGAAAAPIRLTARGRPTITRSELATLVRNLATALEAGLPLLQSLRTVRRQAAGRALPVILDFIIERVEAGVTLHQAAKEYGPPFDDMTVGMFRAADASGRNAEVLHQLADLLDRSVELRRELVGATVYPMIVAGLVVASVIVLVTFVLPKLMKPLMSQPGGGELPLPTTVLLNVADFTASWWWLMLLAIVVALLAWRTWIAVPTNRLQVDLLLLRIPILGTLLRDVAVARFTRTLGTLVSAGIPILQALRVVRD